MLIAGCGSKTNVSSQSSLTFEIPLRPAANAAATQNIEEHIRLGAYYYEQGDPSAAAAEFPVAAQKTRANGDVFAMKHECLVVAAVSQLLADDKKGLAATLKNIEEQSREAGCYHMSAQDYRLRQLKSSVGQLF